MVTASAPLRVGQDVSQVRAGADTAGLRAIGRRVREENPKAEHHVINYTTDPRGRSFADGDDGPIPVLNPTGDHDDPVVQYIDDPDGPRIPKTRLAPDIVEEAYLAVDAGEPLIVAGGFGGAAKLNADALLERFSPADIDRLAEHFVGSVPSNDGATSVDFAGMMARFNSLGVLRNGLTDGKNRELLTSSDPDMVAALFIRSVRRIGSHHAH